MGNLVHLYPGAESGNGHSAMWATCPLDEIQFDRNVGFYLFDDFLAGKTGRWVLSENTATQGPGTANLDTAADGGVILVDPNATAAGENSQIQTAGAASDAGVAIITCEASTKVYFEARVKVADVATGPELFIGLSEIDTAILTSSANHSTNHIGFESVTDNNVVLFHAEKAGNRLSCTTTNTMVEGTWVKLGFIVDGVTSVTPYVNGVAFSGTNNIATAAIPTAALAPSFACGANGSTDPILHVDWVALAKVLR